MLFPLATALSPLGCTAAQAAAPFDPTQIAGLVLWLKADALALADGAAVATWADSSGRGNDASQALSANRPVYKVGIVNSRPVVRFSASSILATPPVGIGAFTILLVFRTATAGIVYEQSTNLNGGNGFTLYTSINSTIGKTSSGLYTAKDLVPNWGTDDAWRVCTHRFSGTHASHQLWLDGVNQFLSNVLISDPGTSVYTDNLFVGARSGPNYGFAGDLAELVVYDAALSDSDRSKVETYLNRRFAIY